MGGKHVFSLLAAAAVLCTAAGGCRAGDHTTWNIPAVQPFELERYLGLWYEAARLPRWFERGMECVTAEYYVSQDGKIRVRNRGLRNGREQNAEGFVRQKIPGAGELEVCFFRPFYGAYRIIALAPDYSAALVCSATKDSAWILVRAPSLAPRYREQYLPLLKQWGFPCTLLEYPPMGKVRGENNAAGRKSAQGSP